MRTDELLPEAILQVNCFHLKKKWLWVAMKSDHKGFLFLPVNSSAVDFPSDSNSFWHETVLL